MSSERERILQMVADGKITPSEADDLLEAMNSSNQKEASQKPGTDIVQTIAKRTDKLKYLRVQVDSDDGDKVNVKVPLAILRAGIKLTSVVPSNVSAEINDHLGDKGINIDLNNVKPEDIDELVEALSELEITVDSEDGDKVRVFCE